MAAGARGDDWPWPKVREVCSKNREYFVRITPGESVGETWGFAGAQIGKHVRAAFFRVQADRGYRLEREIELMNPVAPVDFFVSNAGDLVAVDNWHHVGYGVILALYHNDGKLVRADRLAALFSQMKSSRSRQAFPLFGGTKGQPTSMRTRRFSTWVIENHQIIGS
jgi:hypothetical protein